MPGMVRRCGLLVALLGFVLAVAPVQSRQPARSARVSEEMRSIKTYGFSQPNAVPILTRDVRLYPYHSFGGYEHEGTPRDWKVVRLDNDLIEVFVLPEIGGKVWGARVKKTGHEFIYRNEVVKFRNIALRGPWTSGGIEFNFGVIGHAPSTATPVDYVLRENPDGSVSCIVGTMDLSSRTEWRVEIRLPADKASFETNVLWHNPTPLEQPYYNWMTAAAFAQDDLEMSIPGNAYLQHSGARESWPADPQGRVLPVYANNTFGGNKSFHVVGELKDFFGGYYRDAGYGFGHWARHDEMPGQKLWLWALSRAGGIWEDLLTDTDGQYVEYQAGRLLVQYSPGDHVNPITQAGFDPLATDRWTETWFPLEGIGGLTDASQDGAIAIREAGGRLQIGINAFSQTSDTLRVWSAGRLVLEQPIALTPLEPVLMSVEHAAGAPYRAELRALHIDYSSDPSARTLSRPFERDPLGAATIDEADRQVFEAQELIQARRYDAARPMLQSALASRPWHRAALLSMGDLEYRRARYREGLAHVNRALQLDAYDADANFTAGNLYRALGMPADARDAFGWAARSMAYRSAANVQLSELALARLDWPEARRYAERALDYNRLSLSAWDILAVVGRKVSDRALVATASAQLLALDPLHHFVRAESWLTSPSPAALAVLTDGLRSEYPDQTVLELAIGYARRGLTADAVTLLNATASRWKNPLLHAWAAFLEQDPTALPPSADVAFVFPYRPETMAVLSWAAKESGHWTWTYLLALNLWSFDRLPEAEGLLRPLGDAPTEPAFYVSRAHLIEKSGGDPEPDLRRADALAGDDRGVRIPLIQYYQRRGRWNDAREASGRARQKFPSDFNLDLLHVRSLIHLDRPAEALAVLGTTRVLPSEHAGDSHQMYAQAHTLAALVSIDAGRLDEAYTHLTDAREWPERLGQGRPYDPEERLIRFLMGRVDERRGRAADAQQHFEAVARATASDSAGLDRLDLLGIPALRSLGRGAEIASAIVDRAERQDTDPGVRQMADALARVAAIDGITPRYPNQFGDLDGTLLVRALSLPGR